MLRRTRSLSASIAVTLGLVLAGCAPAAPTEEELVSEARALYMEYRGSVAEVMEHLGPDPWRVVVYGDLPEACSASSYMFTMNRTFAPDGTVWRLPTDKETYLNDVASWLVDQGYDKSVLREYTGDIATIMLTTHNKNAKVGALKLRFTWGQMADTIELEATSTCGNGDAQLLDELIFPKTWTELRRIVSPEEELPNATPLFGEADREEAGLYDEPR